jgi:hypothetical protein
MMVMTYVMQGDKAIMLNLILAFGIIAAWWTLWAAPSQAKRFSLIEFAVFCLILTIGYAAGSSPTLGDAGRKGWVAIFKGVDRLPKPEVGDGKDCTFEGGTLKPTPALLASGYDLMAAPEGSEEGDVVPTSGIELKVPTRVFVRDRATGSRSSTITLTP